MPTIRFQLRGSNLDRLKEQIENQYGSNAKILSVEKITKGGIAGFLAEKYYEVVVEAIVNEAKPVGATPAKFNMTQRFGIAALLSDANQAEEKVNVSPKPESPHLSTETLDFESLLSKLSEQVGDSVDMPEKPDTPTIDETLAAIKAETGEPKKPAPAMTGQAQFLAELASRPNMPEIVLPPTPERNARPTPTREPGDLVLFIGLGQDAIAPVKALSKQGHEVQIHGGGAISIGNSDPINTRRDALVARADAVHKDQGIFVAYGLTSLTDEPQALSKMGADQIWVVVDASRKMEDTEKWVKTLSALVPITAVAVVGTSFTETPDTIQYLGGPVGWTDSDTTR